MHRTLAVIVCGLVLGSACQAGPLDYDDTPGAVPGGIVFIRRGNQRIWRVGGGLLPMRVWVTEDTPQGPVKSQLVFPSSMQSSAVPVALQDHTFPYGPPVQARSVAAALGQTPPPPSVSGQTLPAPACARVRVHIPDPNGLLYVNGRLTDTKGAVRELTSPPLGPGQTYAVRLGTGYRVGDKLVIEDRDVVARPGETAAVTFDGKGATVLPYPGTLPKPRAALP